MAPTKPTILFIPGAWLPLSNYENYVSALEEEGYPVVASSYPSLDPSDVSNADCQADSEHIRTKLDDIISRGNEVVIIGHSYASMPASAAAKGRSVSERKRDGKAGGVLGLIFIAAFLVPEGVSCAGAQGGNLPAWILLDNPAPGVNVIENPIKILAEDQSEAYAASILASLKTHTNIAFQSPQPPAAHLDPAFKGRLGYQVTKTDKAVPLPAQHGMIAGTGVDWIVHETDAGHMAPFGSHVAESVDAVNNMIEQFSKVK